ncbi:MAG: hypothetical protein IPP51_18140 [Bacteroidetes bacterium]|nr:hypothetical protein [Bacteroidota bacterium]
MVDRRKLSDEKRSDDSQHHRQQSLKRPIYFATTVGADNYLNLEPYFRLEGLAYRLVPVRTESNNEVVPAV